MLRKRLNAGWCSNLAIDGNLEEAASVDGMCGSAVSLGFKKRKQNSNNIDKIKRTSATMTAVRSRE